MTRRPASPVPTGEAERLASARRLLGAHVAGWPAYVLRGYLAREGARLLADTRASIAAGRLPAGSDRELVEAWGELETAAEAWLDRHVGRVTTSATAAISAPGAEISRPSAETAGASMVEIDTIEAGRRLGVTPRRVRQLLAAGRMRGRRVGCRWVVPVDVVRAELKERIL